MSKVMENKIVSVVLVTIMVSAVVLAINGSVTGGIPIASGNGSIDVRNGTIPTIDGIISSGEWSDANFVTITQPSNTVTVYFKHVGTDFYVGFTYYMWCEVILDISDNSGTAPQTDDYILHACASLYEVRGTGSGWGNAVAANGWTASCGSGPDTEFCINYSKIGINAGIPKTIGIMFLTNINMATDHCWPASASYTDPSTWGNMSSSDNWAGGGEPPNLPPTIENSIISLEIYEDKADSSINLNNIFSDPESDSLTFSSDKDGENKKNITVAIVDSVVTLTPDPNWNGNEIITFFADDGTNPLVGHEVTIEVIPVNDPPTATTQNLDFSMAEDTLKIDKIDLTMVFDDIDMEPDINVNPQGPLTFSYSGNIHITVSKNSDKASFDPADDWYGQETLTFYADDGVVIKKISKEITVTVNNVNDRPRVAQPLEDFEMAEDPTEDIINSYMVDLREVFSDPDPEGDDLTYTVSEYIHILTLIDSAGIATFIPEKNWSGQETIIFLADDGIAEPTTDDVVVTITPVNDPPILEPIGTQILDEDTKYEITFAASDVDNRDELTFSTDICDKINGLIKSTNTNYEFDAIKGKLTFIPDYTTVGKYEVTISVDDGSGEENRIDSETVEFIINNMNDPPIPTIEQPQNRSIFSIKEKISFLGSCEDEDLLVEDSGEKLSYKWTSNIDGELGNSQTLEKILSEGIHRISFTATDIKDVQGMATITITMINPEEKDTNEDTDNDGLPDDWERKYFGDLSQLPEDDYDNDDYTNMQEYQRKFNPTKPESIEKDDTNKGKVSEDLGLFFGLIGVIVLVVIIIIFFISFIKKRKKKSKDEPTKDQDRVIPGSQTSDTMPNEVTKESDMGTEQKSMAEYYQQIQFQNQQWQGPQNLNEQLSDTSNNAWTQPFEQLPQFQYPQNQDNQQYCLEDQYQQ